MRFPCRTRYLRQFLHFQQVLLFVFSHNGIEVPAHPLSGLNTDAQKARAIMFKAIPGGHPTSVIGVIDMTEQNGTVTIIGNLTGLTPGLHGFHAHEFGDLGNGCLAAGAHYNPFAAPHGGPNDPPLRRHVGDLGNILTPRKGPTTFVIQDFLITFTGPRGIVGRSFVVHEQRDDLGRGGDAGSLSTGNSGRRVACGVIGYVMEGIV
ncbi:unnamed protein product [Angiostrongylus costaricensis]|uniref:Superoxide dismutase [Cu-Zn] n=1 Tax=Angiostrongylus costaricensis TaxID=334426 RepID=A0A0R3Q285_ANGCS|nr:unnamed protein product [Angiostrongylus costaricensis]